MKGFKGLCIGLALISSLSAFSAVTLDSLYCASLDDQGNPTSEVYLLTYHKEFNDQMTSHEGLKNQGILQALDFIHFPDVNDPQTYDQMIGLSFQAYDESSNLINSTDSYSILSIEADGSGQMKYFLMTWPIDSSDLSEAFLFDFDSQDLVASLVCQQFELLEE